MDALINYGVGLLFVLAVALGVVCSIEERERAEKEIDRKIERLRREQD